MKSNLTKMIILSCLMISGVIIFIHYLSNSDFNSVIQAPIHLFIVCLAYIGLQILKRYLFREQKWWDWLYYVGLLAVVMPVLIGTKDNLDTMHLVGVIGTSFFIIPVVLDAFNLIKKN